MLFCHLHPVSDVVTILPFATTSGPRDDADDNDYDHNNNSNKNTSSGSEKSAGDLYLMKCKPDGRSYA